MNFCLGQDDNNVKLDSGSVNNLHSIIVYKFRCVKDYSQMRNPMTQLRTMGSNNFYPSTYCSL
jgi:hypothetical protein